MTQNLPDDFDWISARAECSPTQAFVRIRTEVHNDIKTRMAMMSEQEKTKYVFSITHQDWQFWVAVGGPYVDKGIAFSRTPDGIDVHDVSSEKLLYHGILTLSNEGKCKLKVGEVEYDFWQFRKLALEDVLFTCVAKWRS